jgi:DNA invertase Pin-like site-specific DNA recombinase
MQLRDLRAYCTARGFDVAREYVDTGESGTKDSRPELNRLMGDARKRQFDAIVVWRFDRFARSTKVRVAIKTSHAKDLTNVRLVRIQDTLHLSEIEISEAMIADARLTPEMVLLTDAPEPMRFNAAGDFASAVL